MNSGDHSTSYVPSQDIDFPSTDGGLENREKRVRMSHLLIKDKVLEGVDWSYPERIIVITVATLAGE
jgi:hypothetical protein